MSQRAAALKPEMQYADLAQQGETAQLGMWIFLATEVLFFGGMMAAYLAYRMTYNADFDAAAKESVIWIGSVNTAVLVTSSLTMVMAIHAAAERERQPIVYFLLATAALGLIFLGLKGYEYVEDYNDAVVPVLNFHPKEGNPGAVELFWLFYFYATLLHAVHLTIGIILVFFMAVRAKRGAFDAGYYAPLEVVGLYWSFVDTVWVFLFALIYPIGRSG
ncbi:MAG TPA: cytochrome c oxidase subunit 3 [Stellaceae bacterium]|nr:cytochrome c oxidase subunit 3 [Stellaceae bacterium]